MAYALDMNDPPQYGYSSYRYFKEGERHITRVYPLDVLVIVFDGVLRFHENGKPIAVSRGQYYIQRSGLSQEGIQPSLSPKYYFVEFKGSYSKGKNTLPLSGEVNVDAMFDYFNKLDRLQSMKASKVECTAMFYRILAALLKPSKNTENSHVILKAVSPFIQDKCHAFSLDELQELCGYSKNQIINIFKSETGLTPYAYICRLRIDAAKQLLLNSELSVTQVAADCGFDTYINLYKAFMRHEGMSPIEWRRRHLSQLP